MLIEIFLISITQSQSIISQNWKPSQGPYLGFHLETTQRDLCVHLSILETLYDVYAHSP